MSEILLKDVVIIFGLAAIVVFFGRKLKIPTLVGLLLTGLLSGPHGLKLIHSLEEVRALAEIGIALLLFTIGIELSMSRFLKGGREIFVGGGIQVFLTLATGMGVALVLQRPIGEAVFLGCLLSLSSTAIVVSLLQEKGEISTPHGRIIVSMLVFQDIIVVPMMLLVPVFSGISVELDGKFGLIVGQAIGILVATLLMGHWFVPKVLHWVALTKDTKLFLLTVLFICFSVAWLTASLGLSLAFGAFLSGLIISESEYNYHALGNIFPFQEIFTCFFFVSTGMLINSAFVLEHPFLIIGCVVGIFLMKSVIAGGAALLLGYPFRVAVMVGLALCQVGEFSFLLIKSGITHNISSPFHYQLFFSATLFSMALTPLIISKAPFVIEKIERILRIRKGKAEKDEEDEGPENHVIIVGFGTAGRNLAYTLKMVKIPYIVVEVDPAVVSTEKMKGEPIVFGDATHLAYLHNINLKKARLLAVVTNDLAATKRIVTSARRISKKIYIITRAPSVKDINKLIGLGADEVIPEELEASIEVFSRVMRRCLVPKNEIEKLGRELRAGEYEVFREPFLSPIKLADLDLELGNMEIDSFRIAKGSSMEGVTLREAGFRERYRVTVLLIRRLGKIIWEIDPDMELKSNDLLILFGRHDKIKELDGNGEERC